MQHYLFALWLLGALFQEHFQKNARALQVNSLIHVCFLLDKNKDLFCLTISDQEKQGFKIQDLKEPLLSTKKTKKWLCNMGAG